MYSYSLYENIHSERKCIFSTVAVSEALFFRVQSSSGHEISFFISLVPVVTLNSTQTWTSCTRRRIKTPRTLQIKFSASCVYVIVKAIDAILSVRLCAYCA